MMTRTEMRVALSKWMEWKDISEYAFHDASGISGTSPRGEKNHELPDFPFDLNAMHRAEKRLPDDNSHHGRVAYNNILMRVCGSHAASVSASSEQRCESMCRMLWPEKWT